MPCPARYDGFRKLFSFNVEDVLEGFVPPSYRSPLPLIHFFI